MRPTSCSHRTELPPPPPPPPPPPLRRLRRRSASCGTAQGEAAVRRSCLWRRRCLVAARCRAGGCHGSRCVASASDSFRTGRAGAGSWARQRRQPPQRRRAHRRRSTGGRPTRHPSSRSRAGSAPTEPSTATRSGLFARSPHPLRRAGRRGRGRAGLWKAAWLGCCRAPSLLASCSTPPSSPSAREEARPEEEEERPEEAEESESRASLARSASTTQRRSCPRRARKRSSSGWSARSTAGEGGAAGHASRSLPGRRRGASRRGKARPRSSCWARRTSPSSRTDWCSTGRAGTALSAWPSPPAPRLRSPC
mmetsp:Transcript_23745/g.74801  ORF Transcript_23745/g.74801 Transcript_23745/m.74801 type:complete len:309 (-) Transcript_23745:912-1838(-)